MWRPQALSTALCRSETAMQGCNGAGGSPKPFLHMHMTCFCETALSGWDICTSAHLPLGSGMAPQHVSQCSPEGSARCGRCPSIDKPQPLDWGGPVAAFPTGCNVKVQVV